MTGIEENTLRRDHALERGERARVRAELAAVEARASSGRAREAHLREARVHQMGMDFQTQAAQVQQDHLDQENLKTRR